MPYIKSQLESPMTYLKALLGYPMGSPTRPDQPLSEVLQDYYGRSLSQPTPGPGRQVTEEDWPIYRQTYKEPGGIQTEPGLEAPMLMAEPELLYPYGTIRKMLTNPAKLAELIKSVGPALGGMPSGFTVLKGLTKEPSESGLTRARAISDTLDSFFSRIKEKTKDVPLYVEGGGPRNVFERYAEEAGKKAGVSPVEMVLGSSTGAPSVKIGETVYKIPSAIVGDPAGLASIPHAGGHAAKEVGDLPTKITGFLGAQELKRASPENVLLALEKHTGYPRTKFAEEIPAVIGAREYHKSLLESIPGAKIPRGGTPERIFEAVPGGARQLLQEEYGRALRSSEMTTEEFLKAITGKDPKALQQFIKKGGFQSLGYDPTRNRFMPLPEKRAIRESYLKDIAKTTKGEGAGLRPSIETKRVAMEEMRKDLIHIKNSLDRLANPDKEPWIRTYWPQYLDFLKSSGKL